MAKKCLDNWQYVERHRMASFTVAAGARADDVASLAHCCEGDAAATLRATYAAGSNDNQQCGRPHPSIRRQPSMIAAASARHGFS